MNFNRVSILIKPYLNKIARSYRLILVFLVVAIAISTFPVGWDGENATFLMLPWGNSEEDFIEMLHELFSWLWLILALPYVLRGLLLPLGDSTLVSQTLWLRLSNCSPLEVSTARSLLVIVWGLWLGGLGTIWLVITSLFHYWFYQFPLGAFSKLLLDILGITSYVILSGGIVVFSDFFLAVGDYSSKRLVAAVSAFISIMLAIVYTTLSSSNVEYAAFFPYATPFAQAIANEKETFHHFFAAGLLGILLLIAHILNNFGTSITDKMYKANQEVRIK